MKKEQITMLEMEVNQIYMQYQGYNNYKEDLIDAYPPEEYKDSENPEEAEIWEDWQLRYKENQDNIEKTAIKLKQTKAIIYMLGLDIDYYTYVGLGHQLIRITE